MRKCSFEDKLTTKTELNLCELPDIQRKAIQEVWSRRSEDTYCRGGYRE